MLLLMSTDMHCSNLQNSFNP